MSERKYDELPWRSITVDAAVTRLMGERGETLDDILWITDGPKRAARVHDREGLLGRRRVH